MGHHFLLPSLFSLISGCPVQISFPSSTTRRTLEGLGDLGSIAQESSFKEFTYSTKFQNCEQDQRFQNFGYRR